MSKEALKLALKALEQYTNVVASVNDPDAWVTVVDAGKPAREAITAIREALAEPDYRAMYLKVRDELAALQQSRTPLTSKEIRAIEVDVATNLSLDYPSPAEQFTRAIEARHGIK